MSALGKLGGLAVSKKPGHMAAMGKRSGSRHSKEHMAEIGKLGGRAVADKPGHMTEIAKLGAAARRKEDE
jgi:general stress protein YciG